MDAKTAAGAKKTAAAPKIELTHLFTKTGVQCNDIFWSPRRRSGGSGLLRARRVRVRPVRRGEQRVSRHQTARQMHASLLGPHWSLHRVVYGQSDRIECARPPERRYQHLHLPGHSSVSDGAREGRAVRVAPPPQRRSSRTCASTRSPSRRRIASANRSCTRRFSPLVTNRRRSSCAG